MLSEFELIKYLFTFIFFFFLLSNAIFLRNHGSQAAGLGKNYSIDKLWTYMYVTSFLKTYLIPQLKTFISCTKIFLNFKSDF